MTKSLFFVFTNFRSNNLLFTKIFNYLCMYFCNKKNLFLMEYCRKVLYSSAFGLINKPVLISSGFLFALSYLKKSLRTEKFKSLLYGARYEKLSVIYLKMYIT